MAAQDSCEGQSFRLLECPYEIRNQIYAEILLDFPRPSLEDLLCRAAYEVESIVPVLDAEDYDGRYDEMEQESNSAPDFHKDALEHLKHMHKIDTNILLANRQTFAEAKELIMRRGRLVKVVSSNIDISRRLCASQLCLIDPKYGSLCVLTHSLRREYEGYGFPPPGSEFVLCGRDVDNFCRSIMGDTALILRPNLNPATRHELAFTTNFHANQVVPEYLARNETHSRILQPFRKHLRGFSSVLLQGSCVGLDRTLAAAAVKDMTSYFELDPKEILRDIDDLVWLSRSWCEKNCYWYTILPIYKASDWCKRAVRYTDVWVRILAKASNRRAFVEELLLKAYDLLTLQLRTWLKFSGHTKPPGNAYYTYLAMQAYEMSRGAAKWFGIPDWSPPALQEMTLNFATAQVLLAHQNPHTNFTGQLLAIGYRAAQRALDLGPTLFGHAPSDEELEKTADVFEEMKRTADGSDFGPQSFIGINYDDDDYDSILIMNGMAWWSGSEPWTDL